MTKKIEKKNYTSTFTLVGKAKINDYTYKIDESSKSGNWIYNLMSLKVYCGENCGDIFCEMMGGYFSDGSSKIYAHGKNELDRDDFDNKITVAWEDRNDESILNEIGDLCFITVGLETTDDKKTYYKKFLSEYDAIAYIQQHLENGMTVRVRGQLKYSMYDNNTQVKKIIQSIVLSKAQPEDYKAECRQTVLIDKDSANLKEIDKEKATMPLDCIVLDYAKEINGAEIKGQYPYHYTFEYKFPDISNGEQCKKIYEKLFKAKKNTYTQITFEGELIESGAAVMPTEDDLTDDIKSMVALNVMTLEEALQSCASNGSRERRIVFKKPVINMVIDGEDKTPVLQIFPERYTEDDLDMSEYFTEKEETLDSLDGFEEVQSNNSSNNDELDWLKDLG